MTYTSSLAMRLAGAEELLARSTAFQQRVGAGSIAQAKKRICVAELTLLDVLEQYEGGTLKLARPSAILGVHSHSYVQLAQGGQIELGANGAVWVILTDGSRDPEDSKASTYDFIDWIGLIMDQVAALVGKDVGFDDYTLWPFSSIAQMFEPIRSDYADRPTEDYWLGGYLLFDSINGAGG